MDPSFTEKRATTPNLHIVPMDNSAGMTWSRVRRWNNARPSNVNDLSPAFVQSASLASLEYPYEARPIPRNERWGEVQHFLSLHDASFCLLFLADDG
jgi:hypothetical protein